MYFLEKREKNIKKSNFQKNSDSQKQFIHSINEKVKELESLCISNKQNVPTEIKLIYEDTSKN